VIILCPLTLSHQNYFDEKCLHDLAPGSLLCLGDPGVEVFSLDPLSLDPLSLESISSVEGEHWRKVVERP
jgi:hypothetical protein